jgi:hypothetical protein
MKTVEVKKGDLGMLLRPWKRLKKYLACICVGLPCWFTLGILISFSPEFGKYFKLPVEISAGRAVAIFYIGLVVGDLLSGLISQLLQSRVKTLIGFTLSTLFFTMVFLFVPLGSDAHLYGVCLALGLSNGSWAVFVTITLGFQALKGAQGIVGAAMTMGIVCCTLALISAFSLEDPFGKNLQYWER